ncbi:hypothetical protein OHS18_32895 [Amycolatopsis sp. NBC_00355]|uniref:hypothetical protein n=1 Tax=Amycolatopsis sp. NBC_00355 TaxID=2975957 RepID=UPI002E270149
MRIRIALSLGALVLAGGALTGGIAMAAPSPTAPPQATTTRPAEPPTQAPAPAQTTRKPVSAPSAVPATSKTPRAEQAPRVPRAVPAGPTGDLHLPAIGVTR